MGCLLHFLKFSQVLHLLCVFCYIERFMVDKTPSEMLISWGHVCVLLYAHCHTCLTFERIQKHVCICVGVGVCSSELTPFC